MQDTEYRKYLTKVGHTERIEGWTADIYELPEPYNNIAVCTGYAPFGTSNEKASKVCERWEKLYYNYDYTQRKRMVKRFALHMNCTKQLITANMLCVMLLLFGAVLFINGTDIERLRNYKNESDKF